MRITSASSKYFQEHAGQWDVLREGYFGEAVRQSAISKAYLRPEMVVADVGAGTGFIAAGLAPLVKQVHVIDGSPAMLEVARRNLSAFDNVIYHLADGASLPLPDASVDAVFTNMYLHHCPDPLHAIREMVRLLRPGGRLMITDLDAHTCQWLRDEMADQWMGFDRAQIRQWFQVADLVNVIVDCTGQSCCAESQNPALTDSDGRSTQISVFLATGARRMRGMHQSVQQQYGAIAVGEGYGCSPTPVTVGQVSQPAGASCCAPPSSLIPVEQVSPPADTSCCTPPSYLIPVGQVSQPADTLEQVSPPAESSIPSTASEISLGCGDPLAIANLQPGEIVLDIGSGGGLDALLAAQKVGESGKAIGVDMTPSMLERARRAAEQAGLPQVEFRLGYAESLPVEDNSVDVVISNCVINLCEDKGLAFREAYRVLRPGGRLEISDMLTDGIFPYYVRAQAQEWAACLSGALPETEYTDLIAQAGFHDLHTQRSPDSTTLSGVRVYSAHVSARK